MIDRYVCVSNDIATWLTEVVGVNENKVERIYNGVDAIKFAPRPLGNKRRIPIADAGDLVIGTVGRMEAIKDQITLVKAFVQLVTRFGEGNERLKLAIVGDGTLRQPAIEILNRAGMANRAWLPGACDNVAEILNEFSVFVLPSVNEGLSNTILEAMATGLPVIATDVGGNRELVAPEITGLLVPPKDPAAICNALTRFASGELLAEKLGSQARSRVVERFSLEEMTSRYTDLYEMTIQ